MQQFSLLEMWKCKRIVHKQVRALLRYVEAAWQFQLLYKTVH